MARDLNALVKISRTINSTRDPQELQRNLLECIFEVVPADFGAILLMDQAEDEPTSICSYDREGRDTQQVSVSRELVQRTAVGAVRRHRRRCGRLACRGKRHVRRPGRSAAHHRRCLSRLVGIRAQV